MNSSVPRKSLVTNSLIDLLCDAAMPRQAFCSRPKEVQCRIWNCLAKQFSSKLQAAIPAEAKQSACSEKGTGTAQVISKPQSYNIVSPDLAVYGARMCYFYFFPWDVLFPLLFLQQFLSVPLKKKEKKKVLLLLKKCVISQLLVTALSSLSNNFDVHCRYRYVMSCCHNLYYNLIKLKKFRFWV